MSDIVIQAEGLGKKYLIGHQTERERYTALRDVLMRNARDYWRKAKALAHGEPIVQGDEQEEIWALRDVSFEIRRGEAVGIIGRNGAGKSTLLKILSRITEPSAGRVTIKGRVASLLEVGTGFHPELTGRENIYLNGAILGMSRQEIKRKFDEIVDFAEVEKFLDTPVKRYSSGMYVRLAFAVAAHLEPDILVVDEVLAVGDAEFQKKCFSKMEDVGHAGKTILFVSHNMTAIKTLCSHVILLNKGMIKSIGISDDVVAEYISGLSKQCLKKDWIDSILAPQNSVIRLWHVSVCDSKRKILEKIYTNTPITIYIDFEVKQKSKVGITIITYDQEGTCIFSSINNRSENYTGEGLDQGRYVSKMDIPPNFLNNKKYYISILLYGPNYSDGYFEKDALILDVEDSPEIRGGFFGEIQGCIRPDFLWTTAAL